MHRLLEDDAPTPAQPASERAAVFDQHRTHLFSIAYRMLGSAAGAEDVVQDAYLRWDSADPSTVRTPKEYLSTTVARLALDQLRSARARRETYVGPWLPEPLVGVDARDPLADTVLAESLSTAFILLLEKLTPPQRAAFLLREVFDFDHEEISRILETTTANARQLVARAKRQMASGRPRFDAEEAEAERLAGEFFKACTTGDLKDLVALLESSVVAWSDGGGMFAAARRPVVGSERVARFIASLARKWTSAGSVEIAPVSGGLGLVARSKDGRVRAVTTVEVARGSGRVCAVFIVVNPEKLSARTPAG